MVHASLPGADPPGPLFVRPDHARSHRGAQGRRRSL